MKKIKGEELAGKELEVLEDGTLRLIENKSKRFIPDIKEDYWHLNYGEVTIDTNDDADSDNWIINHQPTFRTEKECIEYKKFLELLDDYKFEPDWENIDELKYYLYYDYSNERLRIAEDTLVRTQGAFYFNSKIATEKFIGKVGKGNIKRFMFDVWE